MKIFLYRMKLIILFFVAMSSIASYVFAAISTRAVGDFDDLNALFEGTKIKLPDVEFTADLPWPLTSVDIAVENNICTNLSIGDMDLVFKDISNQRKDVQVTIQEMMVECEFEWWYEYNGGFWLGWIEGDGTGQAYIGKSSFSTKIAFQSEDFNKHPPSSSLVLSCTPSIEINDLDFQGGISGSVANTFEGSVRGIIEQEVEKVRDLPI